MSPTKRNEDKTGKVEKNRLRNLHRILDEMERLLRDPSVSNQSHLVDLVVQMRREINVVFKQADHEGS